MMTQSYSGTYVAFGTTNGGRPGFGGSGGSQTNLVTTGSTIQIADASGNILYTAQAVRAASYVLFSSPTLVSGSSYTLKSGGVSAATATAGTGSTGGMEPGGQQPGETDGQNGSLLSTLLRIISRFKTIFHVIRNLYRVFQSIVTSL